MSDQNTRGIRIRVESEYLPGQSEPEANRYLFSYRVRIENAGREAARLVARRWRITDGLGRVQVVEGPGVVGEQPRLAPGETFEYRSFCPLPTGCGTMEGAYRMVTDDDEAFEAAIAPFFLVAPGAVN